MALKVSLLFLACILLWQGAIARKGYGPGDQEYGHVTVRNGANMFYWLFYVQAEGVAPTERPLVIWLQGGPGADSTGYGNFAEIGPLHIDGTARTTTWAQYANLLFIDNPVGTGWSYVQQNSQLTSTNEEIGQDMVSFLDKFFNTYPDLRRVPVYIFSESYGGKMTVEIAKQLVAANLDIDFRGVTLGDSWISPIDSVNTWGPFLLQTGVVDQNGADEIATGAANVQRFVNNGQWLLATNAWGNLEGTVGAVSDGVDFYNILYKTSAGFKRLGISPIDILYKNHVSNYDDNSDIQALMDGPVKDALQISSPNNFGSQSGAVFSALSTDFMKPVTSVVEELLNTTDLQVTVLTGQLDLIVDTPGTVQWVDRLKWPGATRWANAARTPISVDGYLEGYQKNVDKLTLYWINRSGHMIPTDNPDTSVAVLRKIIGV